MDVMVILNKWKGRVSEWDMEEKYLGYMCYYLIMLVQYFYNVN